MISGTSMDKISGPYRLSAGALLYAVVFAAIGSAQLPTYTGDERVVLPASKDTQDVPLKPPAGAPAGAVTLESLKDASGAPISPQPSVTAESAAGGLV